MKSSLTAYVSKMIEKYSAEPYSDLGYRLPRAMTREDRQRAQQVRQDPSGRLWYYRLDQGDEIMRFTHATKAEKKWKRMGILVKMFVRQADICITFTAYDM